MARRRNIEPDEYRQRTLEGPEDGPLRAWVRDIRDGIERWAWLWRVLGKTVVFVGAAFTIMLAAKAVWDTFGPGAP